MNEDGACISTVDSPVFICERCGNILRVLFYEPDDVLQCQYCGFIMTKTDCVLSDDESYLMYDDSHDAHAFQDDLFRRYVSGSEKFSTQAFDERTGRIKKTHNRFGT